MILDINFYKIFYWLTVADNAKAFFIAGIAVSMISGIVSLICTAIFSTEGDDDIVKASKKWWWRSVPLIIMFWGLYIFTPSKSDTLLIIAGGAVGNFVTSDSSSKAIPSDITSFLHMKLQAEILDANDEVKRQLGAQTPKEKLLDKAKELTKEQLIEFLKNDSTLVK